MAIKTSRKSVDVNVLLQWSNGFMSGNSKSVQGARFGVAALLEEVLYQSGNKFGYKELSPADNSQREYFIKG